MSHDHNHDHHAPPQPDDPAPQTEHHFLGLALNELLIEKGIYSAAELRQTIEQIESVEIQTHGALVVARAWADSAYKQSLLTDANQAVEQLGLDSGTAELKVLENTDQLHNVVVCTLCSCYPRALLGRPPAWYKDKAYRARVVREPRTVLAEFGTEIPESTELRVHDSTAELRFLVLPQPPQQWQDLTEQELVKLITRDSMIGVAVL